MIRDEKKYELNLMKEPRIKKLNFRKIILLIIMFIIIIFLIMIAKNSIELINRYKVYQQYEMQLANLKQQEEEKLAELERIRQERIPKLTQNRKR